MKKNSKAEKELEFDGEIFERICCQSLNVLHMIT